jgi:S1-C subfamily serine protease
LVATQGGANFDDGLLPEERVNIAVYENCNRSVVHIATRSVAVESFQQISLREGSGSGSVLDTNGIVLTNHHVIDGAKDVSVSLFNGLQYTAFIVGQDPDTDIALLKISAPPDQLIPLEWGDSQSLRVGQRIYAIGNPFGLERTMSTGMISSLNRQISSGQQRTMRSLIQIDAALNQGNSGGPLLNTRGQLIGMNTAIMSSNGDSAGVGFAIPASTLRRIVPQLLENGRVIRPTIGITRVYENERGLLIVRVAQGGPADRAGLQGFSLITKTFRQGLYRYEQSSIDTSSADLITAVDGNPVKSADDLLALIETKSPGDVVVLTVVRDGQTTNVPVTLGQTD